MLGLKCMWVHVNALSKNIELKSQKKNLTLINRLLIDWLKD